VEAVHSQKTEDLIQVTENAFHYFGGTTAAIVPDNLKSAVTKSSKYEPQINVTTRPSTSLHEVVVRVSL
jgi:transposase